MQKPPSIARSGYIVFPCTNESLAAIVAGMDVSKEDHVLAVGGSGDQAFALSEHVGSVGVIDADPTQRDFIESRIALLEKGDVGSFVWPLGDESDLDARFDFLRERFEVNAHSGRKDSRNGYFLAGGRFEKIRSNANRLTVLPPVDVIGLIDGVANSGLVFGGNLVNKVYLSNVLGNPMRDTPSEIPTRDSLISGLANALPNDGLIYVADGHFFTHGRYKNHPGVVVDEALTEKALEIQSPDSGYRNWTLTVLRVVK